MVTANIMADETVHTGGFGINIAIDAPIINLVVTDFVFQGISGDGETGIVMPETLEVSYLENPVQTVVMLPIELRENASGSFRVFMLTKLYTVDNSRYGIVPGVTVGLPVTEQKHIACEAKEFHYNTRGV